MPEFLYDCHSPEETRRLASKFASALSFGDIITLVGDMGTGKTTFVQGVAQGLNIQGDRAVTSPSFTLINRYSGRIALYHADLYRLGENTDFADLELEEVAGGDGVLFLEWPQIASFMLKKIDAVIYFNWDMTSPTKRTLRFVTGERRYYDLLERLKDADFRD